MTVDPIKGIVNKRSIRCNTSKNKSAFVVAVEEDGWCRDVTLRYTAGVGAASGGVKGGGVKRREWWKEVMVFFMRPYRLVSEFSYYC